MANEDEYETINMGDLVELVIDPSTYGMAIGFQGSLVIVRVNAITIMHFHEFELRKMTGVDPGDEDDIPEDNVINFTDAKAKLTANTKTRGAA